MNILSFQDVDQLSDQAAVGVSRSTMVQSTMVAAVVPSLQDSDHNEATADVHQLSDQADVGVGRSTTVQSTMLPAAVPGLPDSDHDEAAANVSKVQWKIS